MSNEAVELKDQLIEEDQPLAALNADAEQESSEGGKASIFAAIAANIGVAIVKFIASAVSGSSAMFSEAIHSLVDCGNGILILIGMKKSKRKPDFDHPFGSGHELYFYTLIVSLAIFFLGGGVAIMEGVETVQSALEGTATIGNPLMAYIVVIAAICIEGASLRVALKNFNIARGDMKPLAFIRQTKDPSLYTVVLEDSAAELGLLFALLGTVLTQTTRLAVFDGIASILIGALLCCVATLLLTESKGLLVGEGITAEEVTEMRELVEQDENVLECGRILTLYMGPTSMIVGMDVTFAPGLRAEATDVAIDNIEMRIKTRWPETAQVFIEVESMKECLRQQQIQENWER